MSLKIQFEEYGDAHVLRAVDETLPAPGVGEVTIANRAISLNPVDWKIVAGHLAAYRPVEFPAVPGNESAGVIEAVGPQVDAFAVGDEVIWYGFTGGYRARANVEAGVLTRKPSGVDFEQAASLPVAGGTAYSAVAQVGIGSGDVVLIHGAAGGIGSAAVQIALDLGATVIGTASPNNHNYLTALGAQPVPYGDGLVEAVRAIGPITASIDTFGDAATVAATVDLLPDLSRAVTTSADEKSRAAGIAQVVPAADRLAAAIELAERGALRFDISERISLAEASRAFEISRGGHLRGKIILVP